MERMEQEISRSFRENLPLSLILADIDHFKGVNDRHGHQVGDLVLQKFAVQLKESCRPYDFVGRYGGEEFVICLPAANGSQILAIAERMRQSIEKMGIALSDGSRTIRITASFGVVTLRLEQGDDVDSIIGRADDALYKAKNSGRNRVCAADQS